MMWEQQLFATIYRCKPVREDHVDAKYKLHSSQFDGTAINYQPIVSLADDSLAGRSSRGNYCIRRAADMS